MIKLVWNWTKLKRWQWDKDHGAIRVRKLFYPYVLREISRICEKLAVVYAQDWTRLMGEMAEKSKMSRRKIAEEKEPQEDARWFDIHRCIFNAFQHTWVVGSVSKGVVRRTEQQSVKKLVPFRAVRLPFHAKQFHQSPWLLQSIKKIVVAVKYFLTARSFEGSQRRRFMLPYLPYDTLMHNKGNTNVRIILYWYVRRIQPTIRKLVEFSKENNLQENGIRNKFRPFYVKYHLVDIW